MVCLFAKLSESAAGGSVSVGRFVGQLSDERVVCVFVSVLCLQVCCVVFACVWQAMCVAHVSVEHGRGRWW